MILGAINFVFGLPAFRTIDTLGRRKWLITTLLPMAFLMAAAAASFVPAIRNGGTSNVTTVLVAVFLYRECKYQALPAYGTNHLL